MKCKEEYDMVGEGSRRGRWWGTKLTRSALCLEGEGSSDKMLRLLPTLEARQKTFTVRYGRHLAG